MQNNENMQKAQSTILGIVFKYWQNTIQESLMTDPEVKKLYDAVNSVYAAFQTDPDENSWHSIQYILLTNRFWLRKAFLQCLSFACSDIYQKANLSIPNEYNYQTGILLFEEEVILRNKMVDFMIPDTETFTHDSEIADVCISISNRFTNAANVYLHSVSDAGAFLYTLYRSKKYDPATCFHILEEDFGSRMISMVRLQNCNLQYKLYTSEEEIPVEKFDVIVSEGPGTLADTVNDIEYIRLQGRLNAEGCLFALVPSAYLSQMFFLPTNTSPLKQLIDSRSIKTIVQLAERTSINGKKQLSIMTIVPENKDEKEQSPYLRWNDIITMIDGREALDDDRAYGYEKYDDDHQSMFDSAWGMITCASFYKEALRENYVSHKAQEVTYDRLRMSGGILLPAFHLHNSYEDCVNAETVIDPADSGEGRIGSDLIPLIQEKDLNEYATGIPVDVSTLEAITPDSNTRLVSGPAVIAQFSKEGVKTGMIEKDIIVAVGKNLMAFKAHSIKDFTSLEDTIFVECFLHDIHDEFMTLYYASEAYPITEDHILKIVVKYRNEDEKSGFVWRIIGKNIKTLQDKFTAQSKEFERQIHRRKHAMSQTVSSLSATWNRLNHEMNKRESLSLTDTIGRNPVTVQSQFAKISALMKTISLQTDHLTDVAYCWGEKIEINPMDYFYGYADNYLDSRFRFDIQPNAQSNENLCFIAAKDALDHIMQNIVSNAVSHGFTDPSRKDYCIRINWSKSYDDLVMSISNNGSPIMDELDTSSITDFGVSSALNVDGHSGIGCYDIKNVVEEQGGSFRIASHKDRNYSVEYIISFPCKK